MMSLPEFLLARLDEDEARARDERVPQFRHIVWDADMGTTVEDRVLADVEAKRRIVVEHSSREVASMDRETWGQSFTVCRRCCDPMNGRQIVAPCPTLCLLALPFADHPDYRAEWKP